MLGGGAGGVHLVNMESGDLLASPKMEDHEGPVSGLSAHLALRHFISCGSDGMLKVRKSIMRASCAHCQQAAGNLSPVLAL